LTPYNKIQFVNISGCTFTVFYPRKDLVTLGNEMDNMGLG